MVGCEPLGSKACSSPATSSITVTSRQLKPLVEAGCVRCARCGELIRPGEPWDLGHDDVDRSQCSGPEHARCNRATSSHRVERKVSREW
jgi:hypothetical protein